MFASCAAAHRRTPPCANLVLCEFEVFRLLSLMCGMCEDRDQIPEPPGAVDPRLLSADHFTDTLWPADKMRSDEQLHWVATTAWLMALTTPVSEQRADSSFANLLFRLFAKKITSENWQLPDSFSFCVNTLRG